MIDSSIVAQSECHCSPKQSNLCIPARLCRCLDRQLKVVRDPFIRLDSLEELMIAETRMRYSGVIHPFSPTALPLGSLVEEADNCFPSVAKGKSQR